MTKTAIYPIQDFIVSGYIGEFINTLTNSLYVVYGAEGISRNIQRPDAFSDCLPYIGLVGVGLCSGLFHALLGYSSQMADDLSMFFATGVVLHRVLTMSTSKATTASVGISIATVLVVVAYLHCSRDELIIHHTTFGIMITTIGLKTMALIHKIENPLIQKKVYRLSRSGAVIFISGFIIWVVDHGLCTTLISLRRLIGMPWSFILELHGWWHIFTAIGAYIFIVLVEYLTTEASEDDLLSSYAWPVPSLLGRLTSKAGTANRKQD